MFGEIRGMRAGEAGILRFRWEELMGCSLGVWRGVGCEEVAVVGFEVPGEGWIATGLWFLEFRCEVDVEFDELDGLSSGVPRGVLEGVRLLGWSVGVVCSSRTGEDVACDD